MVVQSEFPDFELVNNLSLFALSGEDIDTEEQDRCISKLSQAWDINAEQLHHELNRMRPIALHFRKVEGLSTTEAWSSTLRRAHGSKEALSPVLQRMAGICITQGQQFQDGVQLSAGAWALVWWTWKLVWWAMCLGMGVI